MDERCRELAGVIVLIEIRSDRLDNHVVTNKDPYGPPRLDLNDDTYSLACTVLLLESLCH